MRRLPAGGTHELRGHAWRVLALWALVALAYSSSFQSGLVFDNAVVIAQDPRIRAESVENIGLILSKEYWYTSATSGLYRPLTTFSYLLNYAVFGNELRPAGYHAVNLALQAANVALVYTLGILVFQEAAAAMALAGLWGLHPLLTESVTNIVGRADLLAAFGVLVGLLCSVRSARVAGRRKVAWLAGLAAAQTIGLFSKESAAVLPGVMLLYDVLWSERAPWRQRWPAYATLAIPFAAFFSLRAAAHVHMQVVFSENPLAGAGFWTARLTAVKVIGKFLGLFLWPARLSADYSYNAVPLFGWGAAGWQDVAAVIALVVCAGAGALILRYWRTHRELCFFVGFFFVTLAPVSNLILVIGSIMAERFVYLPSVGLAGCAVVAIQSVGRRFLKRPMARQAVPVAMVFVGLVYGARTYARNFDWGDDLSLWSSAARVCPESARAHNNLGNALSQIPGRLPEAIAEFEAALRIRPGYAEAHYNLGNALAHTAGRLADAIAEYQAALHFPPDHGEAVHEANVHVNLGNALARTPDRLPDAIAEFQAALKARPDLAEAHYNLGNALARMPGRMEDSIAEFQAALRIQPELVEAHYSLGSVLLRMPGRVPDAVAEFEAVLRARPDPELQRLVDRLRGGAQPPR
jgi:protein O-mannosyl-transferase